MLSLLLRLELILTCISMCQTEQAQLLCRSRHASNATNGLTKLVLSHRDGVTIMARSTNELGSTSQLAKTLYGQLCLLEEGLRALHLE